MRTDLGPCPSPCLYLWNQTLGRAGSWAIGGMRIRCRRRGVDMGRS